MDIPFATQSYKIDSKPVSAQRVLNAYAESEPADAKKQVVVFGDPGVSTFCTCGSGPIRAMHELNNKVYVVSGQFLYSFDQFGNTALLGAGISGSNPLNSSIDDNGTQLSVVNGSSGWIYNQSSLAFSQIVDPNFNAANTVVAIDGYFLYDWATTAKFFSSNLFDGTTYQALMFATAEATPGSLVLGVHNAYGNLAIIGQKTIEFWQDTGSVNFPWQRINGATVERGTIGSQAWAEEDNGHFFVGDDLIFYRIAGAGGAIQRLSTHAIEKEWQTYSTTSDVFCFAENFGGHKFINVVYPTVSKSWRFDIANAASPWTERSSYDPSGLEVRRRVNCAIRAFGKTFVGDSLSGQIGVLDPTVFTEFGQPMILEMISPPIDGNGLIGFMPEFQLDIEQAVGLASGQGSNPQIMMSYSDDGGRTWSSERWVTMGAIGNYLYRARWTELGSFYQRVIKIRITDPVKRVILSARAPGLYFSEE